MEKRCVLEFVFIYIIVYIYSKQCQLAKVQFTFHFHFSNGLLGFWGKRLGEFKNCCGFSFPEKRILLQSEKNRAVIRQ